MDVISSIRNIRASLNISPAKEANLSIRGSDKQCKIINNNSNYIKRLAKLDKIQIGEFIEKPNQSKANTSENKVEPEQNVTSPEQETSNQTNEPVANNAEKKVDSNPLLRLILYFHLSS